MREHFRLVAHATVSEAGVRGKPKTPGRIDLIRGACETCASRGRLPDLDAPGPASWLYAAAQRRDEETVMAKAKSVDLRTLKTAALAGREEGDRHARDELVAYLGRATGTAPAKGGAPASLDAGEHAIWLYGSKADPEAASAAVRDKGLLEYQTEDDFFIERVDGQGVVLGGASVGALHYAVYELLGRIGFAWPSIGPRWEVAPQGRVSRIPDPSTRQSPRFRERGIDPVDKIAGYNPQAIVDHLDWCVRNRWNRFYVMLRTDPPHILSTLLPRIAREAALRGIEVVLPISASVVVPRELVHEHPEYFAFHPAPPKSSQAPAGHGGGVPVEGGFRVASQLCMSNPATRRAYAQRLRRLVDTFPDTVRDFHPGPNDGAGFCTCEKCRDLAPTDQVQLIWNTAHEALRDYRPDVRLIRSAYTSRQSPPEKVPIPVEAMHRVHYDVFCRNDEIPMDSGEANNSRAAGTEGYPNMHAWLMGEMKAWIERGLDVVPWHNSMKMYRRGTAAGLVRIFAHDLDLYEQVGAAGSEFEAYAQYWHGFAQNFFAASRLLWDRKATARGCLEDFSRLSFGPAAAPMLDYLRLLERLTQAGRKRRRGGVMDRFTDRDVEKAEEAFTQARRLARGRVLRARGRDVERHFRYLMALREENLCVRDANRALRRGRWDAAAQALCRAADQVEVAAQVGGAIESEYGVYGFVWPDAHRRRIFDLHDRARPACKAAAYGLPPLGPGTHALDLALFDTPHYGPFGRLTRTGVRIVSEFHANSGRNELAFFFRLGQPDRPVRLHLHGGAVVPALDQRDGIKPSVRVTVNGKRLFAGPVGVPLVRMDPAVGARVTAEGPWTLDVPARLLGKRNTVALTITDERDGRSAHFDAVSVEV